MSRLVTCCGSYLEFDMKVPDADYQKEELFVGVDVVVSDGNRAIAARLPYRPHVMVVQKRGGLRRRSVGGDREDKIAPVGVTQLRIVQPAIDPDPC